MARIALFEFRYPDAKLYLEKSLQNFNNNGTPRESACQKSLGTVFFYLGEFDQAHKFFSQSRKVARTHNQVGVEANTLIWLGRCAQKKSNLDLALNYATEAETQTEHIQNVSIRYKAQAYLAYIQALTGDIKQAIQKTEKLQKSAQHIELYAEHPFVWNCIAQVFDIANKPKQAQKAFEKAIGNPQEPQGGDWVLALLDMSRFYIKKEKDNLAEKYVQNVILNCQAMGLHHLKEQATNLLSQLKQKEIRALVGNSAILKQTYAQIEKAAQSTATVLITGETGTGKELAARTIHDLSNRKDRPFISINCAAFVPELLQSELFGHRQGAFTGATTHHKGLFEAADGGTIFLDEIGDANPLVQASLLRVLQEGEIRRVGDNIPHHINVRVIVATNTHLKEAIQSGTFRQDLYYRLSVLHIHMPPLRHRIEDIPTLAKHLLAQESIFYGKIQPTFTPEALQTLITYPWPGNVRELKNEMQRIAVLTQDHQTIDVNQLSDTIGHPKNNRKNKNTLKEQVSAFEKQTIQEALIQCNGNISKVATQLGLSRTWLYKKMEDYNLR